MVIIELLDDVRKSVSKQRGIFNVTDVASSMVRPYDHSLVREAIWLLIDRGEADLAYPGIGFVRVSKGDDDVE